MKWEGPMSDNLPRSVTTGHAWLFATTWPQFNPRTGHDEWHFIVRETSPPGAFGLVDVSGHTFSCAESQRVAAAIIGAFPERRPG